MKSLNPILLSAFLSVALLGGCSNEESERVFIGTAEPSVNAVVPRTALRAATLNEIVDPELRLSLDRVLTVHSDNNPTLDSADALIVEGTAGLSDHPKIDEFLEAGRSVIFLNLSDADKRAKLFPRSIVGTGGSSRVIALKRDQDRYGRPVFFIAEWPDQSTPAAQFETVLEQHLNTANTVKRDFVSQDVGFNPPPGLIYASFNYSYTGPSQSYQTTLGGKRRFLRPRTPAWSATSISCCSWKTGRSLPESGNG